MGTITQTEGVSSDVLQHSGKAINQNKAVYADPKRGAWRLQTQRKEKEKEMLISLT
jgi:hypothetical protein